MSNVALLTAAGSGSRMHQDIPKQFLTVNERPVIVYTLEAFQRHPVRNQFVMESLNLRSTLLQMT